MTLWPEIYVGLGLAFFLFLAWWSNRD
jgi:hypothetical protein